MEMSGAYKFNGLNQTMKTWLAAACHHQKTQRDFYSDRKY